MEENVNLDWFSFWSGIVPDQRAITILETNKTYSYGDINEHGDILASYLHNIIGIKKGDRVGVLAKNCIENIYLFSAAQKLGFILVPLNYRLTTYELSNLIKDAQLSILYCSEEYSNKNLDCESMLLSSINNLKETGPITAQKIYVEDPIFILYTSGSTGLPKGVLYTHKMLYWNSMNTSISLGVNSETVSLVCMPPFHTGGWNVLLTPVLHHGGHIVLTEKFDASKILEALKAFNCNQFMAVPTMLKMISEEPTFTDIELSELPYIIVGGEAMPINLIELYEDKNIAIRQGFGMTEAGPNLTSLHHSQSMKKIGSIGKPNMYVKVKVVDDDGNEVRAGKLGELCFAGPIVMPAYWNRDDLAETGVVDGWLHSGDIAIIDTEGYIYIKDRKKNMFISGAENVYPAEIEHVLLEHELVSEAIVLGVADEKWGEVGQAYVVSDKSITAEDLKDYCSERLSKYKIPKYFEFIDEMPVSSTGKIDRKALSEWTN